MKWTFIVKNNGTATTGYQLLNSNKQPVASGTTVKSLVGQDFYISMPVATTGYVEVEANIRYTNRNQTLWTADGIEGGKYSTSIKYLQKRQKVRN